MVSADRLQSLSVKLSTVEQIVLDAAESELAEARIISRRLDLRLAPHTCHHGRPGKAQEGRPVLRLLRRSDHGSPAGGRLVDVAGVDQ